jgi:iron complex outermembrane receptor protein
LVYEGKTEQLNNITKIELGELGWLGETSIKNVFNTVRNLGVHTKYDSGSPLPNGLVFNNYDFVNFVPVANPKSDGRNDWLDDFSEEIQIFGSIDGKHDWIVGYYYEEDNDELNYPPLFSAYGNVFSPTFSPSVVASFSKNSLNRDRGYFAQGTADLSDFVDGLKLTYGWRHSESNFDALGQNYNAAALTAGNLIPSLAPADTFPRPKVRSESNTHNVGLDYQVSPDMLLYVASRTGFKPGGANVAPPAGALVAGYTPDYGPEKVEDIEFGMKADWDIAGHPLRTNVALYRTWYRDIQRSQTLSLNGVPFTQTGNIAKARIDGLELTAVFQATDRLLVSLNYSYIDPEYLKWPGTTTEVLTGQVKQLKDSPFVGTPENQGTLSLSYILPTPAEWGEMTAQMDYYKQSSVHLNDTELADGFGKEPGYDNINLRLSWANVVGAPVDLALFVTNLKDDIHAQSLNSFYSVVGTANAVYSEPRMWGAEVRYRFGANK